VEPIPRGQAERTRLSEAEHALSAALELSEVLDLVPRLAAAALRAESAILRILDEASGEYRHLVRFEGDTAGSFARAEEVLAALTRREAVPVLIPDCRQDPQLSAEPGEAASALSVPLLQRKVLLGTLTLFRRLPSGPDRPPVFEERDLNLLVGLGTQAAIAIENARLFHLARKRNAELSALQEIGQAIASRLELPAVLEAVAAGAMRLLGSQFTQILLWDEGSQTLRYGAALGPEAERVRAQSFEGSRGVNATVARTRQSMVLDDYQASSYALPEFPDVAATVTTPVLFGDRLLGVLHSHSAEPGKRFTADDLRLLERLATQAAIAIENAGLYEEARVRTARLRALNELTWRVTASLDLAQVFDYTVQAAVDLLGLALARLWVWQEDAELLRLEASAGDANLVPLARETIALGEGVTGAAFASLQVLALADAGSDPRYLERSWALEKGVKSLAAIPIRLGERGVGVLAVARRTGRPFREDEVGLLNSFTQHVAIAIENARLFREKERLAVEELLRLRKISILSEIGTVMQGTMQLDALLHVILTGVTYGGGLGFNRAILLLVDAARRVLTGRMGVGPSSGEEAARIWGDLTSQHRPLGELIAERGALREDGSASPFDRLARSLEIPLTETRSLLVRVVVEARPFRVRGARQDPEVHPQWEGRLDVEEFACVPLAAKGKVVGVIVVDNKFNGKPITDEDLDFLSVFASQAGLAVENAQVYTRLEEANREIQRHHHALLQQERMAALGEMAAHVVHEIRNPLVAIGGFARRLTQRLKGREPEGQYAQIIAREAERLERIAQDVRGLTRDVQPTLATSDLHALLRECLVLFDEKIMRQRVRLHLTLAEPPPVLRLDSVQMRQAILNLVANALEAMPSGGILTVGTRLAVGDRTDLVNGWGEPGRADGQPPVDHSAPPPLDHARSSHAPGEWVVLSVDDTGGGIPDGILGEIFNPFFTTKDVGTGLGLTLVRRIVRAHGGRVEVENHPGEGVTFHLWLPVTEARASGEGAKGRVGGRG